jgi:hypothetical protein
MSRPQRRQAEDFARSLLFDTTGNASDNISIRRERKMMAVLLEGAEWEQDDCTIPFKLFNFGPGQIFQEHSLVDVEGIAVKRKT